MYFTEIDGGGMFVNNLIGLWDGPIPAVAEVMFIASLLSMEVCLISANCHGCKI